MSERFYIHSGVRRAVASRDWGRKTVPAFIYREGMRPEYRARMRLGQLYSPKDTVNDDDRFVLIVPPIRTPIEVEPLGAPNQTRAVPLARVQVL